MAAKSEDMSRVEVKLTKNIKYGEVPFYKGMKIKILKSDYEEFRAAGVIEIKEE